MADLTGLPNLVAGDVYEPVSQAHIVDFEAEADITKGYPVYLTADMKVSPSPGGDNAIGIATKTVVAGEMCPVCVKGIVKVTAAGAITRGAAVCSAAGGKVTQLVDQAVDEGGTATYTIYYARKLGIALQGPTADGDLFWILVEK
jgi:hypothetical protein